MKTYENGSELPKQPHACRDCQRTEPEVGFAVLQGKISGICRSCAGTKRNLTVAKQRREDNSTDDTTTDARIQAELWRNYRASKSTGERIRVLEALVKLRPADQKSELGDAAVIQSLMESLKKKKAAAPANG